jgi:hypothetical protein
VTTFSNILLDDKLTWWVGYDLIPKEPTSPTDDIETAGNDVGGSTAQAIPPKERTKSLLAKIFIGSFLLLVGFFPLVLLYFGRINIEGYKDIVLTLASVLGGPLGIVITSYFKEGQDK